VSRTKEKKTTAAAGWPNIYQNTPPCKLSSISYVFCRQILTKEAGQDPQKTVCYGRSVKQTIESTALEAAADWLCDRQPTAPGRKTSSIGRKRNSKRP
jgi:hypothetical protein